MTTEEIRKTSGWDRTEKILQEAMEQFQKMVPESNPQLVDRGDHFEIRDINHDILIEGGIDQYWLSKRVIKFVKEGKPGFNEQVKYKLN